MLPEAKPTAVIPPPHAAPTPDGEPVITLAASYDRQRLRAELLRVILRNEAQRTGRRLDRPAQDNSPTEGPATLTAPRNLS